MNNVFELNGECTGCSACSIVCPTGAISMKKNKEGFFAPSINFDLCIKCGICKKVCIKETPFLKTDCISMLALQAKDKNVLLGSSSGGVATTISQSFVLNGGFVLGSFFNYKTNTVETKTTNCLADLELFKKSKYLQSDFHNGLMSAVRIAKEDKTAKFLIFGTPCQINGAVNVCEFYGIKDQFTFVDFFCHGVPSYLIWDYYLSDKGIDKDSLSYVSFRTKKYGWQSCFAIQIKDSKKDIFVSSGKDDFYNSFFDNVFLMKSCYSCKYRSGFSKADARLGDYWGGRYSKNEDGVSSALVFTEKGKKIMNSNLLIELPAGDDILFAQSTNKYTEEQYREFAFRSLDSEKSLKKAINKYRKRFPIIKRFKLWFKKIVTVIFPKKIISKIKSIKWKKLD